MLKTTEPKKKFHTFRCSHCGKDVVVEAKKETPNDEIRRWHYFHWHTEYADRRTEDGNNGMRMLPDGVKMEMEIEDKKLSFYTDGSFTILYFGCVIEFRTRKSAEKLLDSLKIHLEV